MTDVINFNLELEEQKDYLLSLDDGDELNFDLGTAIIVETIHGDPYEGSYEVTPKKDERTVLATRNKVMTNDVTVFEIPYQTVSNLVGGTTAIIGGI